MLNPQHLPLRGLLATSCRSPPRNAAPPDDRIRLQAHHRDGDCIGDDAEGRIRSIGALPRECFVSSWPIGMRLVTIPGMPCDWMLVDGSSLIFRAFYGAQRRVKDAEALRTAAIGGFLFRLARLIVERGPVRIAVADDVDWRPHWRVEQLAS